MAIEYSVQCPKCGYRGYDTEFEVSMSDEAFCPACNYNFEIEPIDDDEFESD